jgi:hypothetical protein
METSSPPRARPRIVYLAKRLAQVGGVDMSHHLFFSGIFSLEIFHISPHGRRISDPAKPPCKPREKDSTPLHAPKPHMNWLQRTSLVGRERR